MVKRVGTLFDLGPCDLLLLHINTVFSHVIILIFKYCNKIMNKIEYRLIDTSIYSLLKYVGLL